MIHTAAILIGALLTQLPPGHPPMPDATPPPAEQGGLQQAVEQGPKGILAIRAIQGTKGGPEVGGEEVEVVLFHRDRAVKQIKAQLDEHGVVLVNDVPVSLALTPLVRVKHAGVLYQDSGPTMDAANPNVSMDVTVYEVSDDPPPWNVAVRNVMASENPEAPDRVAIGEVVVVENPADRTWIGAPADAQNRRATVVLTLPPGAKDITLQQGFHGWCCTEQTGQTLTVQMPLMPGRHTYKFRYSVPLVGGKADLRVASAAPAVTSAFLIPTGATTEPLTLLKETPPAPDIDGRMFEAAQVPAGEPVGLVLTGWGEPLGGDMPGSAGSFNRMYLWIGAGVALLIVGLVVGRRMAARS